MALSNEQKKDLESKINKGLTPICPICKSKLIVSPVQEGDDGSKGREYECSRDKLKEGKTCDLEPGFAYIQGWKRIPLALNKNIINGYNIFVFDFQKKTKAKNIFTLFSPKLTKVSVLKNNSVYFYIIIQLLNSFK